MDVNPISVGIAFLDAVKAKFPSHSCATATEIESLIARKLWKTFCTILNDYVAEEDSELSLNN